MGDGSLSIIDTQHTTTWLSRCFDSELAEASHIDPHTAIHTDTTTHTWAEGGFIT